MWSMHLDFDKIGKIGPIATSAPLGSWGAGKKSPVAECTVDKEGSKLSARVSSTWNVCELVWERGNAASPGTLPAFSRWPSRRTRRVVLLALDVLLDELCCSDTTCIGWPGWCWWEPQEWLMGWGSSFKVRSHKARICKIIFYLHH